MTNQINITTPSERFRVASRVTDAIEINDDAIKSLRREYENSNQDDSYAVSQLLRANELLDSLATDIFAGF